MANRTHLTPLFSAQASRDQLKSGSRYVCILFYFFILFFFFTFPFTLFPIFQFFYSLSITLTITFLTFSLFCTIKITKSLVLSHQIGSATWIKRHRNVLLQIEWHDILIYYEIQGGDDLLNEDGFPKPSFPNHWKGKNGLYCVGLSRRGFYGANLDAQNVANDIASLIAREETKVLPCDVFG